MHSQFIYKYINVSEEVNTTEHLKKYLDNVDCVIVGSDQVWRKAYSPNIYNYFLECIKDKNDIKKISYAASFGIDFWEYNKSETSDFKDLINFFDYVSVRENSAVDLCKIYLNCNAELVLDPTLLLTKNQYIQLFDQSKLNNNSGIFTYVLDNSDKKNKIIKNIETILGMNSYKCQPEILKKENLFINDILKYQYPPIENWLKSFFEADFIVTDSFHGTVFSIIFNKPFITIKNDYRGNARFESLLDLFDLRERLISVEENITEQIVKKEIDFWKVNSKLDELRCMSTQWLNNALVK